MDSWKGPKRLFDLESSASGQHDASEIEADREDAKRQHKALESSEDDFEEFVALLDRIQHMKTSHMKLGVSDEIAMPEDSDVKVKKTKSPCIPSFQWEDFCTAAAAKDIVPPQRDICSLSTEDNRRNDEEKGKQSIQPANYVNMGSSSDASGKSPARSFDLNVEATS